MQRKRFQSDNDSIEIAQRIRGAKSLNDLFERMRSSANEYPGTPFSTLKKLSEYEGKIAAMALRGGVWIGTAVFPFGDGRGAEVIESQDSPINFPSSLLKDSDFAIAFENARKNAESVTNVYRIKEKAEELIMLEKNNLSVRVKRT